MAAAIVRGAMRQGDNRAGPANRADDAGPSAAGPVLVVTKLRAPTVRAELVPRRRLVDLLVRQRPHKLTLVDAPAGWGKTTLLAEWQDDPKESRPFAWVSLDRADNDPVRFWTLVVTALRTVTSGLGERALAALSGRGPSTTGVVLAELINEVATGAPELVLVLDDYHSIGNEEIHQGLELLLERLPAQLHLAMASRSDPPLPLARMRVRGELLEVRSDALAFNDEEAAALLNAHLGLGLSGADVARLQQRTEGWAAALYLAALSLRGRADAAGFIGAFAGDNRHVVDYLGGEVLAGQPAERRRFLVRTSILERLCGPLCDTVTGGSGSAGVLEEIERANLFLVPLDATRTWYRYHHLFGELLRHELRRTEPELEATLHRRAAAWYQAAAAVPDAIQHAVSGGAIDEARELIAEHWLGFFNRGELATVAGWLDALPRGVVEDDPRLAVARVWLALDLGRPEEAGEWLQRAERGLAEGGSLDAPGLASGVALLRAVHRFKIGEVGQALVAARRAVDLERAGVAFWRTVASVLLGVTLYWRGAAEDAGPALEAALELAEVDGNRLAQMYALGYLAAVQSGRGAAADADRLLERAAALVEADPAAGEHFVAMMAHLVRAGRLEEQGQPGAASHEAERGLQLARRGAGLVELGYATLQLAGFRRRQGDLEAARALVAESRRMLDGCADPGMLAGLVAAAERSLAPAGPRRPTAAPAVGERLTERELAVLRLLPSGMTQREIGATLFLSENTVKTHTRGIYRKLAASGRDDAVARARAAGLL
jgi:LuxR family transcriptional regulator, maltose regulon positive regulatory protein